MITDYKKKQLLYSRLTIIGLFILTFFILTDNLFLANTSISINCQKSKNECEITQKTITNINNKITILPLSETSMFIAEPTRYLQKNISVKCNDTLLHRILEPSPAEHELESLIYAFNEYKINDNNEFNYLYENYKLRYTYILAIILYNIISLIILYLYKIK